MLWLLLTSLVFLLWIVLYRRNKAVILSLPFLLIFFISSWYRLLDVLFFVEIFGCGCVPITQTNMFNISFNANDLRILVYTILNCICIIMGIVLSKKINNKVLKGVYIFSIVVVNILYSQFVNYISSWA